MMASMFPMVPSSVLPSDASTALTTPADEMRWQDFVEQLTRNRTRTWAIARDVVDQYHATLRGELEHWNSFCCIKRA